MPSKDTTRSNEYESLKAEIDRQSSGGQFVAIESEQLIADAACHRELVQKLEEIGRSPKDTLIIQAGVEYPASSMIPFDARVGDA